MKRLVNIAGIPTQVEERKINIYDIYLDQENPRIAFYKDAHPTGELTQADIEYALVAKSTQDFNKLKESIESNRGVLHPIWVIPAGKDRYRVLEGNTRLVIYRKLNDKYLNDKTYQKIPCWVLPPNIKVDQMSFIRLEAHLRGTTDWDTYEKAKYLYKLNEEEGYSIPALERLTKLSRSEIESSIKAFMDMEKQYLPKYGKDPSEVYKFSYFVEYEKNRKLRDTMRKSGLDISNFCKWVGEGKVFRAMDVRELPELIESEEVRKVFIEKGYDLAMEKLSVIKPDKTSRLFQNIERVAQGLMNLTNWEITQMREGEQPERVKLIHKLYTMAKKTMELIESR